MSEIWNSNSNRGQYASISNTEASSLPSSDLSRIIPRQLSTGTMRGTQNVGYGNTKIDGSNNVISVGGTIKLDGNSGTFTVISSATTTDPFLSITSAGLVIKNAQVTFLSITQNGMVLNDGTNDRVLIGKQIGGFS